MAAHSPKATDVVSTMSLILVWLCEACASIACFLAALLRDAAGDSATSNAAPPPEFYLNVVVLNREETIKKHVGSVVREEVAAATKRWGDLGAWAAGAASNVAANLAAAAVTDGDVGLGVGGTVSQLVPMMLTQGFAANGEAEVCFAEKGLCVVRCRVLDVDVSGMVERLARLQKGSAQAAWARVLKGCAVVGAERAVERAVKARAVAAIAQQMVAAVPDALATAVDEQTGLRIEVTAQPAEAQATHFFGQHRVRKALPVLRV